jgi:DNA-binding transcriptional LysR family regulator
MRAGPPVRHGAAPDYNSRVILVELKKTHRYMAFVSQKHNRIPIAIDSTIFYKKRMDIDLARTFLEVSATGSFVAAAQRLHLTQAAVSARVRVLEEQLGRRLFVRNKAGARLTAAGEIFVRHATALIQVWERARQQVALPSGRTDGISLGGEVSLWHPYLSDWLVWMHRHCTTFAVRAEVDSPARLIDRVQEGLLDVAVVYSPPPRPDLVAELLVEEKLVLVTTAPDGSVDPAQYVYVDWGPAFAANHRAAFPHLGNPPVSVSLGPLALTYMLKVGGSGYFRIGTARPFIRDGRLRPVEGAPEFSHSAFALYASGAGRAVIGRAREGLCAVVKDRDRPGIGNPIDRPPEDGTERDRRA